MTFKFFSNNKCFFGEGGDSTKIYWYDFGIVLKSYAVSRITVDKPIFAV